MDHRDRKPSCAAEALWGIRTIIVNGKSIGISGLCDAIIDVQDLNLIAKEDIKSALLERVSCHNYIPETLRTAYADAFF
ncbi:MAG: hypothetical protein ABR887_05460 [Methanoregulaceae archaeon]|jgi:hypothetical protein